MSEQGLGNTGCTLAARLPGSNDWLTNGSMLGPDYFTVWNVPLVDTLPYTAFTTYKPGFIPPNFPYGILVEADVPM